MDIIKTFRYRLEPTPEQRQMMVKTAGCCRFVYNHMLTRCQEAYARKERLPSWKSLFYVLTELRAAEATAWLMETSERAQRSAIRDLDRAYKDFFRRLKAKEKCGPPRFHAKGENDAFRWVPPNVKIRNSQVYFPKIGWVAFRESRPLEGVPLGLTVRRTGDHWFLTVPCRITRPDVQPAPVLPDTAIGIDLGLTNYASLSTGTVLRQPAAVKRAAARLAAAESQQERMVKGSRNWHKQAAKIGKLRGKLARSQRDFAHKATTALVRRYDTIAVEDLDIAGMIQRSPHLKRDIRTAAWGEFVSMLQYKAQWAGKHVVKVDRFFPSSQLCSSCGARQRMPLEKRKYECPACGLKLNRDLNASLNIRAAGLADLNARDELSVS